MFEFLKSLWRKLSLWPSRPEQVHIDQIQETILAHTIRKAELELQLANITTTLESERLSHRLKMAQEKDAWELEKRKLVEGFELDHTRRTQELVLENQRVKQTQDEIVRRMKFDFDMKEKEMILQSDLKIKILTEQTQLKIDREVHVQVQAMLAERQKQLEENFNHLADSLKKLHSEGNAQTKFVEALALKMLDAKPATRETMRLEHVEIDGRTLAGATERSSAAQNQATNS